MQVKVQSIDQIMEQRKKEFDESIKDKSDDLFVIKENLDVEVIDHGDTYTDPVEVKDAVCCPECGEIVFLDSGSRTSEKHGDPESDVFSSEKITYSFELERDIMITKDTFQCGNNTLVGLDAKEVLEFLFSRSVGCGYRLAPDYMNVGFSVGIPYGNAKFNVIHFNDRDSYSKGFIEFEFDYIKPSIWNDKRNIIEYTLTAGKITKSEVGLNPDYIDEIFEGE